MLEMYLKIAIVLFIGWIIGFTLDFKFNVTNNALYWALGAFSGLIGMALAYLTQ